MVVFSSVGSHDSIYPQGNKLVNFIHPTYSVFVRNLYFLFPFADDFPQLLSSVLCAGMSGSFIKFFCRKFIFLLYIV